MSIWQSLRRTAAMPLRRLLTGHGDAVTDHARLVRARLRRARPPLRAHRRRSSRRARSAFEIAQHLWRARIVREQPLLVVWEVLGHLDLLLDAGVVREDVTDDGSEYGIASFTLSQNNDQPEGGGRPARASRESH